MEALTNIHSHVDAISTIHRPDSLEITIRENRHISKPIKSDTDANNFNDLAKWMENQKIFTLSTDLENQFILGVSNINGDQASYMKTIISSLLENQLTLSAALDETREACAQLNFEKAEAATASSSEVCDLQIEISLCRQREAEIQLAYEELQHRVESIDKIIEQIPWLDFIFNSKDPLSDCVGMLEREKMLEKNVSKHENLAVCLTSSHKTPHFHDWGCDANTSSSGIRRMYHSGSDSPLSDSGCTSESHDDFSLASMTSAYSSPYIRCSGGDPTEDLYGELHHTSRNMNDRNNSSIDPKKIQMCTTTNARITDTSDRIQIRRSRPAQLETLERPVSTFGRITDSLKKSITKFADKSEWKMEALRSQQREAQTLLMLNETQAELRRVKARCCGLKRLQDQQEARILVYSQEVERLKNTERQLRRELRTWQQRIFQVETENQEIKHDSKIVELENKSRLLEANMRLSQMEQFFQQKSTYSDLIPTQNQVLDSEKSSSCLDLKGQKADRRPLVNIIAEGAVDGLTRPPRWTRVNGTSQSTPVEQMLRLRQRFASTSNLSAPRCSGFMLTNIIPENHISNMARTSSTCQMEKIKVDAAPVNLRTISFGSLSELELKTDI